MAAEVATGESSKRPSPPDSIGSGRSRRSPQKPVTPRPTRSSTLPNGSSHQPSPFGQQEQHKPPSPVLPKSETKKRKPIFVSCVNFPESRPAPPPNVKDSGDLQRSQRKSKVEAINKLDRAGTPTAVAAGPAATSFVPPPPPPAGPSVLRNPLKRARVVNPPFDLETVRTKAPSDPGPSTESRAFGLPTCPTYHPTAEQFRDPMAYVESIAPEAKRYGICKIVPPEGWQMPFALETDKFRFTTRLQRLNSIEAASRAKINFLEQLSMFHKQQGDTHAFIPRIDHRLLDLWRLRKEVNTLGGVDEVNRLKAWTKITSALGFAPTATPQVKAAYTRLVLPFENWALRAKSFPESPHPSANGSASGKAAGSPHTPTGRMGGVRPSPRSRMAATAANGQSQSALNAMSMGADVKLEPGTSSSLAPPAKIRIKVPGFQTSSHDSDSELSDEELSRASTSQTTSPETKYEKGDVCEVCGLGNNAPKILLCDGCDRGFHTFCLDPPLSGIPANEWYCTACLLGNGDDFGFDEGEEHSLPTFQARDAAFTQEWFNRYAPSYSAPGPFTRQIGNSRVSEADVEREFWRLVESPDDTVEVEYGADVHSTTHGSAAPTFETFPTDQYARDPWNLNNMPILRDSLLRYIKSDISGMTVPWIYVGMLFSAFCWHNEDHYTYSVNYMFWGETKTWYGIPGADAEKFETAIKKEAPELFERQPSLLYQLVTMMNPGRVREQGVDVYACDQRPNEFVITFPKAYHSGFNHGFNFNEAVNFALPDWLPEGRESVLRYQEHAKPPVFSHAELLITITLYSDTIKTALWLQDSLRQMVKDETESRQKLREAYPDIVETLVEEDVPESQYQCCVCKSFCYLSQVKCDCTPLVVCMDHADMLCECPPSKRTLRDRFSEDQLQDILDAVVARAAQPEQWQSRLEALLSVARPQLKAVRQLVADGEKIPHPLPGLADLRAFLNRANAWLEKALAISTRKSTGRRKKGRQSEAAGEDDGVDRSPAAINALLEEANQIGFDTIEIAQLHQMVSGMEQFRQEAQRILSLPDDQLDYETCNTALILGESLNIELPEVVQLRKVVSRLRWYHKIEEEVDDQTLQYSDVQQLLKEAKTNGVPDDHPGVVELRRREVAGREWQTRVDQLLASPKILLDDVAAVMEGTDLIPTSVNTMRDLENIYKTALGWQQTASTLLATSGSATAARRLLKSITTATNALRRVVVPEINKLTAELEFTSKWLAKAAKALDIPVQQLSTSVSNLLREYEDHLQEGDEVPNDDHACFCRMAPSGLMVSCVTCNGSYHPKCIGIFAKSPAAIAKAGDGFQCQMCRKMQYDDRPSVLGLAEVANPSRWNFVLRPPECEQLDKVFELSSRYARLALRYIGTTPGQKEDAPQIIHLLRKIWTLPVRLDCENVYTNEIVVFEDWLYRRWREATDGGAKNQARTRARKPRFQFVDAVPHTFHCICKTEPLDHLLTVQCAKCEQGFHLSCAKAPITQANAQGRGGWRCPFCVIKMGKPAPRGMDLRVQMEDKVGTDEFIDWRQTLYVYAEQPIPVKMEINPNALVLICTKFHGPALPDDFEVPVWEAEDQTDGRRKRRKTEPVRPVSGVPVTNGTMAPSIPHAPRQSLPAPPRPVVHPTQPSQAAATPNAPAQNVRPNGRTYYPTHTVVPWENSDMFSQFHVNGESTPSQRAPVPSVPKSSSVAPPLPSRQSAPVTPRPETTAPAPRSSVQPAPLPRPQSTPAAPVSRAVNGLPSSAPRLPSTVPVSRPTTALPAPPAPPRPTAAQSAQPRPQPMSPAAIHQRPQSTVPVQRPLSTTPTPVPQRPAAPQQSVSTTAPAPAPRVSPPQVGGPRPTANPAARPTASEARPAAVVRPPMRVPTVVSRPPTSVQTATSARPPVNPVAPALGSARPAPIPSAAPPSNSTPNPARVAIPSPAASLIPQKREAPALPTSHEHQIKRTALATPPIPQPTTKSPPRA